MTTPATYLSSSSPEIFCCSAAEQYSSHDMVAIYAQSTEITVGQYGSYGYTSVQLRCNKIIYTTYANSV